MTFFLEISIAAHAPSSDNHLDSLALIRTNKDLTGTARELQKEYELVACHGFVLQLDAPNFGLERARLFKDKSDADFLHAMDIHVEAINRATANIPRERLRRGSSRADRP
jgi:hypothetical protein